MLTVSLLASISVAVLTNSRAGLSPDFFSKTGGGAGSFVKRLVVGVGVHYSRYKTDSKYY